MLHPHARIAVIAPAGRFDPERLARGMREVEEWGYTLVPGANLNAAHRYNAGTDAQRSADLNWALTATDIDAVWFARGGYGTGRLLENVPWAALDRRPVIGFSDATALFTAFVARSLGQGVHAPVLHSLVDVSDDASRAAVRALLAGKAARPLVGAHLGGPHEVVRGPVVGGNLAVMTSLVGTAHGFQAQGKIVILEDVGEAPYRLDRMLTQLVDSGTLDGCLGLALGQFTGCDVPDSVDWTLLDVIRDRLMPLGVPIIADLPVGHGAENLAWVVGAEGQLGETGITWLR